MLLEKNALLRGRSTIADSQRYHVVREMKSDVAVPFLGRQGLIIDSFPKMEIAYSLQTEKDYAQNEGIARISEPARRSGPGIRSKIQLVERYALMCTRQTVLVLGVHPLFGIIDAEFKTMV